MYCPNTDCPALQATGDPAEYRKGTTECADCGASLVEKLPELEELEYEAFVPVLEIADAARLSIAKSLLSSTDIHFFIKGEGLQDLFGCGRLGSGFSVVAGPPVVYVEPDRAQEARELLEDLGKDKAPGPRALEEDE